MTRLKSAGSVIGYGLIGGILMSLFSVTSGWYHHLFALAAVILGVRFFREHDSKGKRIGFLSIVILLALIIPPIYVTLALKNGWPVNPSYMKIIHQP